MNINKLTERIIIGDITEGEILLVMKDVPMDESIPNLKVLLLSNGWEIHHRTDVDYTWICGREAEEEFELGIGLFCELAKANKE